MVYLLTAHRALAIPAEACLLPYKDFAATTDLQRLSYNEPLSLYTHDIFHDAGSYFDSRPQQSTPSSTFNSTSELRTSLGNNGPSLSRPEDIAAPALPSYQSASTSLYERQIMNTLAYDIQGT